MDGLMALCAVLTLLLAFCLLMLVRQRRRTRALTEKIEGFLAEETNPLSFSLREDRFSVLENSVSDLTERLIYRKSRSAKEQDDTNRLLLDISHQLKTPLASLRLFCEMDAGKHQQQELHQINHMEHLIYSLLRLERLRADGYRFDYTSADARTMAKNALCALRPLYPSKRFSIAGSAAFRCDPGWMTEALHNLLKNACEHTRENGRIDLQTEQTENAVFITIQDDGGGVDKDDLPHLFERFYRSKKAAGKGAGIGLAMVREIIRRHHGSITCENKNGGLKIMLCIPLHEKQLIYK